MAALFNLKRREIIVNLIFFVVFTSLLVLVTPNFHPTHSGDQERYIYVSGRVALFYNHTLVIIPLILRKEILGNTYGLGIGSIFSCFCCSGISFSLLSSQKTKPP
jgi:uncharacterized membrane protein YwaF